jgi:hypothetical protein
MVMARETRVQIVVRITVHNRERENEESLNTYRYESKVGFTGINETWRFTIAIGSLKDRARMFSMGKRHIPITRRQNRAIITSPIFFDFEVIMILRLLFD